MSYLQTQTTHSENDIRSMMSVLGKLNLNATPESAEAMLNLIEFTCKLNGSEKPTLYPGDLTLNLNSINRFMQHNFFDRKFGFIVPIIDESKIKIMKKHSDELENWFETIGFYNTPKVSENDIASITKNLETSKDNRLIVRVMGNNELILEQQFRKTREILEQIPKHLRGQVEVKLLGKTNINMFFGEDRESEILIMRRLGRNWLGDLGCQIDSVAKVGNANTIDTIRKEESSRTNIDGETMVLDVLCPNGAERQKEDIELEKLKNKRKMLERVAKINEELAETKNKSKIEKLKREQENLENKLSKMEKEKHFYDGCGGVKQLRETLIHNKYGAHCDEHQLAYKYYNQEPNGSDRKKFRRLINLIDRLDDIYYPNMLCEDAKSIYSKCQYIQQTRAVNLLSANHLFSPDIPISRTKQLA